MLEVKIVCLRPLIERGQVARWNMGLKNRSPLTTLPLSMRAFTFETQKTHNKASQVLNGTLERSQEQFAVLSLPALHCGLLQLRSIRIAVADLFGFFYLNLPKARVEGQFAAATVLPLARAHTELFEEALLITQAGEVKSKQALNESDEFHQLRPLRSGDPLKRIHWKLSARSNAWVVKQNQPADEIFWTLLCDVQTISQSQAVDERTREHCLNVRDYALDAAAALIENALLNRKSIVLKTYESHTQLLKGADLSLYPQFLRQLATTPAHDSVSLKEQLLLEQQEPLDYPYIFVCTAIDDDSIKMLRLFMQNHAELYLLLFPLENRMAAEQNDALDELRLAGMRVSVFFYPQEADPMQESSAS